MFTYADAIDSLIDTQGTNVTGSALRIIRESIQDAYREVGEARKWNYLLKDYRLHLNASYSTGTVEFDLTGGANERQLTLTTGTWPSWAARGRILISSVVYEVDRRISDSIVTLGAVNCPAADIAAGTSYQLYQDIYSLPDDFIANDQLMLDANLGGMHYVSPAEWLYLSRSNEGAGVPRNWTVMNDPDRLTRMALFIYPPPNSAGPIDFLYRRRPQPLIYSGHDEFDTIGKVTTNGTVNVTGSSTQFESGMVGSVLRVGRNSRNLPTGPEGAYPFKEEVQIKTVTDATTLVLESAAAYSSSGVAYIVSDPIDFSPAMLSAFRRCCERNLAIKKNNDDVAEREARYMLELRRAKAADVANMQPRHIGQVGYAALPLRRMPIQWPE